MNNPLESKKFCTFAFIISSILVIFDLLMFSLVGMGMIDASQILFGYSTENQIIKIVSGLIVVATTFHLSKKNSG